MFRITTTPTFTTRSPDFEEKNRYLACFKIDGPAKPAALRFSVVSVLRLANTTAARVCRS